MEDAAEAEHKAETSMPSSQQGDEVLKKYGLKPKKPPLISKDHERAYFDSADWALGKPTQQQTRYRKSAYAPGNGEGGGSGDAQVAGEQQ